VNIGGDHELWTLMVEEDEKLFLESFDKALRSDRLAGPGGGRSLDRTLIYTALTRGIEQVVIIGDRDAFDAAVVASPRLHERQIGFSV
jgi:hypothetical protein